MSILGYAAVQAVSEPSTHPLDLTTPRPQYSAEPPVERPAKLEAHERVRNLAAARHAELRYPGPAGMLLAREIRAFNEWGYRGDNNSPINRLIRELMQQQ